ncbi:hypothetical protein TSUD_51610 [Trifolium subterraneum]|uniref:Major facilitator superfamily (MFS) profile domain-containing protein n=1 Tax=Trifolium subterraneum TaxID=3900 RepID=A0A2Z6LZQ2_TRISU|nr:hypothetical protein TSUD_51610 [Trifolium subterraneum]
MEGLTGLAHLFVTMFLAGVGGVIAIPSITDVTMSALCPGQDECSLAIYLTGFQHAMIGVGSVVTTPLIGNLSDRYGRKVLITLPLTVSLIPQAILAYSRETKFFYAYYLVKTLAALAGEGSFHCLALAYVADKVPVGKRASAFGILAGVGSASFVGGTLAARFLSTALTFQVASVFSMMALVYMRIFLKESEPMRQPLLKEADEPCIQQCEDDMPQRTFKKLPSMGDVICLLKCSIADGGLMAILLYYLKARFQYNKNQFADLMMISGIGATLTQLFLMPILVPAVGEEKLLTTGLFVSCINILVYSISWSAWVPYALAGFSVLGVLVRPTITSIASKQVGPNEQGMVQGCLSGVTSVANIISPLIFSPLTALFLSENAPFNFPGFSLMCLGLILMTAFFLSLMIRAPPPIVGDKVSNNRCTETLV